MSTRPGGTRAVPGWSHTGQEPRTQKQGRRCQIRKDKEGEEQNQRANRANLNHTGGATLLGADTSWRQSMRSHVTTAQSSSAHAQPNDRTELRRT